MKYIFEISDTPENVMYPISIQTKASNGVKSPKQAMDVPSLIAALNELYDKQSTLEDSGVGFNEEIVKDQLITPSLPFGTIFYQNGALVKNDNQIIEQVAVVLPKGIFPASYHNQAMMLGFPTLVFVFKIIWDKLRNSRKLRKGNVFAVKEQPHRVNSNTPFYTFPFPNVSKSSGEICWGNTLTTITGEDLNDFVQNAVDTFVTSNFNDDYGIIVDSPDYGGFSDYIAANENKSFNDDFLIPCISVRCLRQHIQLNRASIN